MSLSKDLVTGTQVYHLRFATCYDARSSAEEADGCGSAGKWWAEYTEYYPKPKLAGGKIHTAEALLAELDGLTEDKK